MKVLHKLFGKYKYVTMSVIIAVLALTAVLTYIHFYKDDKIDVKENVTYDDNGSEVYIASQNKNSLTGDCTFLTVCTDNAKSDITFLCIIDIRVYSEKITEIPLSKDTSVDGKTYLQHYLNGGKAELISAVEKMRNITIDRSAFMTRDGFCDMIDALGKKVTINVTEDYTYASSDKSYEVTEGECQLDAPMLYSYIDLCSKKSNAMQVESELFCLVINSYLKAIDSEDAEKLFKDLSNCVDTDMTVSDYYQNSQNIQYLFEHDVMCSEFGKDS